MQPFSVASVTASCTSISNRAVATAAEVDDTLDSLPQLAGLSTRLQYISSNVSSIKELLPKCPAIPAEVRTELPRHLKTCEGVLSVMDKQLRRLQEPNPQLEIDARVIGNYVQYLDSQNQIFNGYKAMLSPEHGSTQQPIMSGDEMQRLTSLVEQEASQIMQRVEILKPRDDATASSSASGSPPAYTPSSSITEMHGAHPASPSSKGKGFFSGLSQSWNAMTVALRPKPEPFVVPLCQAAIRGDHAQIKGLLAQGANINGRNENGQTALICAVNALRQPTAQFLIQNGAGIAVRDSKGKPPLFRATKAGDLDIVAMLLQFGADPNEKSNVGRPFFIQAALHSDLAIVRLLLEKGANPNAIDITGRSLFIMAVQAHNLAFIRLLAEHGGNVNSRDITGRDALTIAILDDQMELVRYLFSRGADPNTRDITGQAMLVYAVDKGNVELVKLFLDHGADPNVRDLIGSTVFANLFKKSNVPMIKMFLERGVDPNQSLNALSGETPLLHSISKQKWDLAAMLLLHGGNANMGDKSGKTPLLEAMQRNNTRMVQLLLQHGADANQEGKISPAGLARGTNRQDMMQLLRSHGAQGGLTEASSSRAETTTQTPATEEGEAPPDYESVSGNKP